MGAAGGATLATTGAGAARAATTGAAGLAAGALASASSASPLRTWPRLPLPATSERSSAFSLAILAAEGAGGIAVGAAAADGAGAAARGRRRSGSAGRRGKPAQQRADRDRLPGLGGDLRQHARGRRVDLERHLVGLQFDQRLVRLDDVAALLEPFADGRFGDRLAERRDANFCGHGFNAPRAAPFSLKG